MLSDIKKMEQLKYGGIFGGICTFLNYEIKVRSSSSKISSIDSHSIIQSQKSGTITGGRSPSKALIGNIIALKGPLC
jgi:hypothetical protein